MKEKCILIFFYFILRATLVGAEDVAAILRNVPAWTSISPSDDRSARLLCEELGPVLKVDPDKLRADLVRYIRIHEHDENALDEQSKIFVLNRMFFDVPSSDRQEDAQFFGGWRGVPLINGRVNLMWPVGIDRYGQLVLVGRFGGYFGPNYRPLEEFDFFRKKYGIRVKYKK